MRNSGLQIHRSRVLSSRTDGCKVHCDDGLGMGRRGVGCGMGRGMGLGVGRGMGRGVGRGMDR